METVRLGLVGLGNMGRAHRHNIVSGRVQGLELAAVCDRPEFLPEKREGEAQFSDVSDMIASGAIDAIHICTPHFSHAPIGVEALEAGLHVMVEKPLAVHVADCQRLVDAYEKRGGAKSGQVFAAMFNQRTNPAFKKLKELLDSGEAGEVRRVIWQVTDWFRTEFYYASGGWRATWKGEGGGVLLNQCPHNLDLFWWLFGLPDEVTGFCNFGRYHQIEVEDDVTAHFRWDDGRHALFVTSTGESPGVNRLEVVAENGLLTVERNATLAFRRNRTPMSEFSDKALEAFASPEVWDVAVPVEPGHGGQHVEILQNFTDAVLHGAPLISPATEGAHSIALANAALLSAWDQAPVRLPFDAARYERELLHRGETSTFKKRQLDPSLKTTAADFAKSFK
jgi:predicted dehydrogenase